MTNFSAASLEERAFTYDELVAHKSELSADALVLALRDGRALVRANAALGLAAVGHAGRDLLPFLRDSDAVAATAAAEALAHLGAAQRHHLGAIAAALDGARREVVDTIVRMYSELVGVADAELIDVLDTTSAIAADTAIEACARVGLRGLHLLQQAARDERALVRMNAIRGVGRLADLEPVSAIAVMRGVAFEDSVADVRAGALAAIAAFMTRVREAAAAHFRQLGGPPLVVPELRTRALTPAELKAAAAVAPLDELLSALMAPTAETRLNAVRVLALQGDPGAAPALAVATRDPDRTVRTEAVRALGTIGGGAAASRALVHALGDGDPAVVASAEAALAEQGDAAATALVDGLDVANELHGARVAALLGKLADGPALLRDALASTSVDVKVNAALGLGALGKARAGAVLPALLAATSGGNARVRAAAATAIAAIEPRPDRTLPAIAIGGFDERVLTEAELAKGKDALAAAGLGGLAPRLADVRPVVRANAALGLGVIGGDGAVGALAACLRDDDADVRMSAARAIARLGEPAIAACANDLVRALRGADAALATQLGTMLRGSGDPAIAAALIRGLDTADAAHALRICELVCARPAGVDLLCEAFDRPGAQANVARGFVMLGKDQLGKGRAVLERARAAAAAPTRELARTTLLAIDGVPAAPEPPAIAGFETDLLERKAFAKAGVLDAATLVTFFTDGRAVVRANAATALGVLGASAAGHALSVAALLRDDDDRVRVAAACALDQLGDDAVLATARQLIAGLAATPAVAQACHAALAARGAKLEAALVAGLDTSDEAHGARVAELIAALPNARDLFFAAFDSEAENLQINAAYGIGKLGAKKAGPEGRARLFTYVPGPPTRRRSAMVRALHMLAADAR